MRTNQIKQKGFTVAEIMVVVMIIAVVASATVGIAKLKTDYSTKFMSYAAMKNITQLVTEMTGGSGGGSTGGGSGEIPSGVRYFKFSNWSTVVSAWNSYVEAYQIQTNCEDNSHMNPDEMLANHCYDRQAETVAANSALENAMAASCVPGATPNCMTRPSGINSGYNGTFPNYNETGCDQANYLPAYADGECWYYVSDNQNECYGPADGIYPNYAVTVSAYDSWKRSYEDYTSCYNTAVDVNNYNGQLAHAECFAISGNDYVTAHAKYKQELAKTSVCGATTSPCVLREIPNDYTWTQGPYIDGDDAHYPTACNRPGDGSGDQGGGSSGGGGSPKKPLSHLATEFCESTLSLLNTIKSGTCSYTGQTTPNFITTNNISYFNFGEAPEYIGTTPGYVIGTGTEYTNEIYKIYVDIDGANGKLTPMMLYVTRDGKIFPAPNTDLATNKKYLTTTLRYKNGSNYVNVATGLTYKMAACEAGIIPQSLDTKLNYCSGIAKHATCTSNTCEVFINRPALF